MSTDRRPDVPQPDALEPRAARHLRPRRAVPPLLPLLPLLLLAAGCGGVNAEQGHDQVAAIVTERTGAATRRDIDPATDAQISDWVRARLGPSLTRGHAIEIALANNPALRETYERLGVSQADMVQAGMLRNPTLGLDLGFGTGTNPEIRGSLVQDFLDLFVLPYRKRIAREQFIAETLRVAHQALEVVADVSKAFTGVQTAQALLVERRAVMDTWAAAAELAERRYDAGDSSDLDHAEERAGHEEAKLDVARDELDLLERREHLNRLLGLGGAATAWTIADPLVDPPPDEPPVARLEAVALKQRLDVAAAAQQVEVLGRAVRLARGSRAIGRLEIGVDAHQDPDGPRVIGPNLVIELPIFDQRQAMIGRLEAEAREAARRRDRMIVDARSEVRVAHARVVAARDLVERYRRTLLPLRREIVELTLQAYNGMFIGTRQLLGARKAEIEAGRAAIDAVGAYWSARAELERAIAGRLTGAAATDGGAAAVSREEGASGQSRSWRSPAGHHEGVTRP